MYAPRHPSPDLETHLVREHGDVIMRLARWLMQHRAMDGDDIDVRSRWEDFMAQMKMLSTVFTLLLCSSASAQETTKDDPCAFLD